MREKQKNIIRELIVRYPVLSCISEEIEMAYILLEDCYQKKSKVLIAGNGGSAADAEHMVAELMKSFRLNRPINETIANDLIRIDEERGTRLAGCLEGALPAVSLVSHEAFVTAYSNDVDYKYCLAQMLMGLGMPGDVFVAISTSGNSENVINAAVLAKAVGIKVLVLTGRDGGELAKYADVLVRVPETENYRIQEMHLPIYHCWCQMLEDTFFGKA